MLSVEFLAGRHGGSLGRRVYRGAPLEVTLSGRFCRRVLCASPLPAACAELAALVLLDTHQASTSSLVGIPSGGDVNISSHFIRWSVCFVWGVVEQQTSQSSSSKKKPPFNGAQGWMPLPTTLARATPVSTGLKHAPPRDRFALSRSKPFSLFPTIHPASPPPSPKPL